MSDSEDDWFEKDLDEFVVEKLPKDDDLILSADTRPDPVVLSSIFNDDYGGSYNIPNKKKDQRAGNSLSSNYDKGSSVHIQPMSFKKLSYTLDQSSLNIFLDVIQTDSGFIETFQRANISTEMILLTVKTIKKIAETPFTECITVMFTNIVQTKTYWKQIESILKSTITANASNAASSSKQKKKPTKVVLHKNDQEIWDNILCLCVSIERFVPLPVDFMKNVLNLIENNKNASLKLDALKICLAAQSAKASKAKEDSSLDTPTKVKKSRETDIYPTLDELLAEPNESNVQTNIVKGRFQGIEHYQDVQLSLLREDFLAPLRDGVREIIAKAEKSPEAKPRSNLNVRVYPKVRIMLRTNERFDRSNCKSEHLIVDLLPHTRNEELDSEKANANFAKKLMFGSLLCLTTSLKFDDLIIAIVSNRDVDMLNAGYIQIEIIRSYNTTKIFDRDFIMCESEVYFESYRHVYHVIKAFTEETFPMRNYIIDVDPSAHFPDYVPAKGRFCFNYKNHILDLKNTSTWPSPAEMKLNDDQMHAMKHALTHKLSVIQGPPGCGKTFIGLQIIATLLVNTDSQVLVVCYTNHALDQFLSGLLRFSDSMVRIGNQSKNEALDCYNLKQLCEKGTHDKRVKTSLFRLKGAYAEAVQEFEQLNKEIGAGNIDNDKAYKFYQKIQAKIQSISRMQDEIKQIGEYQMINSRRIIGITSTGAARCNALIRLLQTPIVIFEESAEILESHVVSALTKSVQQLILIGDHQQLRPTTSVYRLAKQYHMDVSLFERMINNNLHSVLLKTQYRMRPEIANLIRPMIYKDLSDGENVLHYPNVNGMEKNLYFISHEHSESGESDETTKKNAHESQFLVALCNYLILQGHNPEDITILTTYNGQIFQFSQDRKKYPNLRKVRITVVDNFQGEDNKIVLLSLVRSNTKLNIGFLAFKNRICVALSRAKHGMYVVGNMNVLRKASPLWNEIAEVLEGQEAIGTELGLKCATHQNVHMISEPEDFEELKYGGCKNTCNAMTSCGHLCSLVCHTAQFEHSTSCLCKA